LHGGSSNYGEQPVQVNASEDEVGAAEEGRKNCILGDFEGGKLTTRVLHEKWITFRAYMLFNLA
jgi:hypothetical protein